MSNYQTPKRDDRACTHEWEFLPRGTRWQRFWGTNIRTADFDFCPHCWTYRPRKDNNV